jgi:hypothetical protein
VKGDQNPANGIWRWKLSILPCTWPVKVLWWACSFNAIPSTAVSNESSSEVEETESDVYSSDLHTSDRNMSYFSEMSLEASKIKKWKGDV